MEFFSKAKAVRLKSHLDKFLIADDDEETIKQNRNGSTKRARWLVELVEGNSHFIRLKSSHNNKYLTASDEPFLLGMTGKKALQTNPTGRDTSTEWEPIKDGSYKVKLRSKDGKFLRANGGTPPWRNSVTIDQPQKTSTRNWILWEVEMVDISSLESTEYIQQSGSSLGSTGSSFSSSRTESNKGTLSKYSASSSTSFISKNAKIFMTLHRSSSKDRSFRDSIKTQGASGMEFFYKAKMVRLQSHHNKYLVADEDEESVKQSRNGATRKARWTVESVQGKDHVIRLKSCHGLYLTATDESFLLGMTGKKVLQTNPPTKTDTSIEWEPIKEGLNVKFKSSEGKLLRANGGSPPWRNSITHDIPQRTATQEWVLWGVEIVDIDMTETEDDAESVMSRASSFSSLPDRDDYCDIPDTGVIALLPPSKLQGSIDSMERPENTSPKLSSGMEFFKNAASIRLKSHHDKYLTADSDQDSVIQERSRIADNSKWTVEFVEEFGNVLRLKSCYGKYLSAIDEQLLLGVSGRKVLQTLPRKLNSSIEWEPLKEGFQVRLKTRYGNYLRANAGLPPWRNSITHDIPHRHTDEILWTVEVVDTRSESPKNFPRSDSLDEDSISSPFTLRTPGFSSLESSESSHTSPPKKKSDGRAVYYKVVDEEGDIDDEVEESLLQFKGQWVEELTQKLIEETGIEDIIVCLRNKLDGQLYPLRLGLPPNNATMHIVVVPTTSKGESSKN